jgi:negative regulator of flagellin synthesis FlgM
MVKEISEISAREVARAYSQQVGKTDPQPERAAQHSAARPQHDQLTISDRARELAMAREAVANVPDVRENVVQALRDQIQAGTYQVPQEKLVERLLALLGV